LKKELKKSREKIMNQISKIIKKISIMSLIFFSYVVPSTEFSQPALNPYSPYQHKPGMEPFNAYREQQERLQKLNQTQKNTLLQQPQQPYFYNPYESNKSEMNPPHQFHPQFEYGANEQRSSGSTPGMYNETSYAGSTAGNLYDTNYAGSTTGSYGK